MKNKTYLSSNLLLTYDFLRAALKCVFKSYILLYKNIFDLTFINVQVYLICVKSLIAPVPIKIQNEQ